MAALPWIILFLPLLAATLITFVTRSNGERSARISIAAIVIGFVLSTVLFLRYGGAEEPMEWAATWMSVGSLEIEIGVRLDALSLLMLLVVTGVGSAIHIYSWGYMKQDPGFARYFACLSLFTFSMLGIVLANNFVQMFIFWELVGVSSYLLIGFWYDKESAADAAKKAFLTNRLGDFGFILGIIMVWAAFSPSSINFGVLEKLAAEQPGALGGLATLAGLLIFCGAMGKSAQFPLHVWLPDAMEGPTPVSALIHAATMVAAGVYMLCRTFFVFNVTQAWPEALSWLNWISALDVIAWIGGLTSLMAAVIALQQNDIKRILAYSTLSQLGYMVMAVGCGGPDSAMYHLITHAFFKALLFLGAGSVIYAVHHEQDIWKMGGLKEKMPRTYWTFLLGLLALCGVPPLSGFYSKDAVLASALHGSIPLFVIAVAVAVLTTLYMFRLWFVAFLGKPRSEAASHAEESPSVMTWPLVVLSVPTVLAGLWGIHGMLLHHLLPNVEHHGGTWFAGLFEPLAHSPVAAFIGLGAVMIGFAVALRLYGGGVTADPLEAKLGFISTLLRNRFYIDEIYGFLIRCTQDFLALVADWADRWLLAGLVVRGLHGSTEIIGRILRLVQTGSLHTYAVLFVLGIVVVLVLFGR